MREIGLEGPVKTQAYRMDFSGCMSWWNLGAGAYIRWTCGSPHWQRTSKCAGGAHWSIDVEMLYLTGRLCLFSITAECSVWKLVAWDGMLRGLHHTLRLTCFSTFFSSMGYCILFAWTEQAVCVAESLWSHHPERVHGAATAAFLLENRETEWNLAIVESPHSGMTRGIKVNLFPLFLRMYLFPNKSGDMDLVIFMTCEVFFSEVINGNVLYFKRISFFK